MPVNSHILCGTYITTQSHSPTQKEMIKEVLQMQNALNAKGFICGSADGIIGNNTVKAMFSAVCEMMLNK